MPPGQQDIALGPLPNAREDEGQDEEGRAEADAASSHASSHGGADEHEAGVAIGQVKKNRRSRENRGLSAGAWVEDDEANVMKVSVYSLILLFLLPCSFLHLLLLCLPLSCRGPHTKHRFLLFLPRLYCSPCELPPRTSRKPKSSPPEGKKREERISSVSSDLTAPLLFVPSRRYPWREM
eukprot:107985-Hanusia_phi.AAC.3